MFLFFSKVQAQYTRTGRPICINFVIENVIEGCPSALNRESGRPPSRDGVTRASEGVKVYVLMSFSGNSSFSRNMQSARHVHTAPRHIMACDKERMDNRSALKVAVSENLLYGLIFLPLWFRDSTEGLLRVALWLSRMVYATGITIVLATQSRRGDIPDHALCACVNGRALASMQYSSPPFVQPSCASATSNGNAPWRVCDPFVQPSCASAKSNGTAPWRVCDDVGDFGGSALSNDADDLGSGMDDLGSGMDDLGSGMEGLCGRSWQRCFGRKETECWDTEDPCSGMFGCNDADDLGSGEFDDPRPLFLNASNTRTRCWRCTVGCCAAYLDARQTANEERDEKWWYLRRSFIDSDTLRRGCDPPEKISWLVESLVTATTRWFMLEPAVTVIAYGKYCCKSTEPMLRLLALILFWTTMIWVTVEQTRICAVHQEILGASDEDLGAQSAIFTNLFLNMLLYDLVKEFAWAKIFMSEDDLDEDGLPIIETGQSRRVRDSSGEWDSPGEWCSGLWKGWVGGLKQIVPSPDPRPA